MIRNTLGPILLAKMSDPRFDPVKTSITHVEVPEDLLTARVFVSVAGEAPKEERRTIIALEHAAGYLQEQMMKKIQLRNTPKLTFQIDEKYKKTMRTLSLISEVSEELREKDRARAQAEALEAEKENGSAP